MELQYKLILIWLSFATLCGVVEAFYFSKKRRKVLIRGLDIHVWFTLFRALIAIPLCLIVFKNVGIWESGLMAVIFYLVFPFFHDGFYYTTRELLRTGTYPKYWFDQSTTTSAKNSYNFFVRTIMLIIAMLIFPY
jgi:hypothetical protein